MSLSIYNPGQCQLRCLATDGSARLLRQRTWERQPFCGPCTNSSRLCNGHKRELRGCRRCIVQTVSVLTSPPSRAARQPGDRAPSAKAISKGHRQRPWQRQWQRPPAKIVQAHAMRRVTVADSRTALANEHRARRSWPKTEPSPGTAGHRPLGHSALRTARCLATAVGQQVGTKADLPGQQGLVVALASDVGVLEGRIDHKGEQSGR